ncbi:hypothetical protein WA158_000368 [Blastocystis sp. Blastoise]
MSDQDSNENETNITIESHSSEQEQNKQENNIEQSQTSKNDSKLTEIIQTTAEPYSPQPMVSISEQQNQFDLNNQYSRPIRNTMQPVIGNFPPHRVFSCLPYPKTGGRLGNNYLLWGKETSIYFPMICLIGPHWSFNICTFLFVILFNGAFAYVSYTAETYWGCAICIIMMIITLIFLCLTSLSNPGIAPRGIVYTGKDQPYSVCRICHIVKPEGAFHCQTCDVCVYKLDHHCPWMGKCIGQNNLVFFYCTITCIFAAFLLDTFSFMGQLLNFKK